MVRLKEKLMMHRGVLIAFCSVRLLKSTGMGDVEEKKYVPPQTFTRREFAMVHKRRVRSTHQKNFSNHHFETRNEKYPQE